MSKVSIVLPTFNQCHFLANAIQTIFNQTYTDFELIIVNDGSTDDTAKLLASLSHPQLHVITQENQGLPSALNAGFAKAQGEYWTWTSTDNSVSPNWLEELVKALDNAPHDTSYAFSHYAVTDESGNILYVNRDQRFDVASLLVRHTGNASFLYRAELARQVGPYDKSLSHAEDLDMWVRMAEKTRAVLVESVLYYYRQHNNSMTTQTDKVRAATKGVVTKFLARHEGKFDIDKLFPWINQCENADLERWKARLWLASLAFNAHYYCPVDATVEQIVIALHEKYEQGLVGNIVLLYAREGRWETAAKAVAIYNQLYPSDFLNQLADLVAKQNIEELKQIPFLTLEEKYLAIDCKSPLSQQQLLRNLSSKKPLHPFEELVTTWVSQLEDQKDHPDVWQNIATIQSSHLHPLRLYLTELTSIPQQPQSLLLLQVLEAMCLAYSNSVESAKNSLKKLNIQYPNLPVLMGALIHLYQGETEDVLA